MALRRSLAVSASLRRVEKSTRALGLWLTAAVVFLATIGPLCDCRPETHSTRFQTIGCEPITFELKGVEVLKANGELRHFLDSGDGLDSALLQIKSIDLQGTKLVTAQMNKLISEWDWEPVNDDDENYCNVRPYENVQGITQYLRNMRVEPGALSYDKIRHSELAKITVYDEIDSPKREAEANADEEEENSNNDQPLALVMKEWIRDVPYGVENARAFLNALTLYWSSDKSFMAGDVFKEEFWSKMDDHPPERIFLFLEAVDEQYELESERIWPFMKYRLMAVAKGASIKPLDMKSLSGEDLLWKERMRKMPAKTKFFALELKSVDKIFVEQIHSTTRKQSRSSNALARKHVRSSSESTLPRIRSHSARRLRRSSSGKPIRSSSVGTSSNKFRRPLSLSRLQSKESSGKRSGLLTKERVTSSRKDMKGKGLLKERFTSSGKDMKVDPPAYTPTAPIAA